MTPAVTLEQKNRAMASPLSVQPVLSNKDGLRMNRRSRLAESHRESSPGEKKILRLSRIHHVQGKEKELKFIFLFLVFALFIFSRDYFMCKCAP